MATERMKPVRRSLPSILEPMARLPVAGALVLCLFATGCAVFVDENRRTLDAMDEHLAPASTGARWALTPVTLPAGILGGTVDMVLVHPACVTDDAWADTVELLWTPRGESRFRRAVMLPLVSLATPFVFVGDWVGRAVFAVPPRQDEEPTR